MSRSLGSFNSTLKRKIITLMVNLIKSKPKILKQYTNIFNRIYNEQSFSNMVEHEAMLADRARVEFYYAAISRFVKPGDTVLELGTGLGILSFFAAQQGAKKIYAIDHSDIVSAAKKVAEYNQINNIEFLKVHSKQLTLDTPVDVIIQEQMGNFLFNEHMVENVCDLRDRFLVKGGIIIPSRFEFFIEPVKINDLSYVPYIREQKIHNIDFSCLKEASSGFRYNSVMLNQPWSFDFFLSRPESIYDFDLHTINPTDIPNEFTFSKKVARGGRLDGFIVYFRCLLDDDIVITTAPEESRASNWKYFLLRVESDIVEKGQEINFELKAENINVPQTWRWSHSL
ncbi:50S ribosomal protein L11 methyltransferase [Candidatus Contubernalis alkaliaceticus]|uniref:50S ribosomal protein L11 methyltransferase n=1 Tax=Candidatus Contubernalis alkaliaceticus TaxID=338645 RepID=UPI001F4C41A8|nr:50S ribosomal protein L11 methyltransferase [Candidatus Contubernalis alkalaceticus]UNC93590.1 50S ribosomal protein L11 methyltransferase [Candidatus Contubernalis alkalaceticus]